MPPCPPDPPQLTPAAPAAQAVLEAFERTLHAGPFLSFQRMCDAPVSVVFVAAGNLQEAALYDDLCARLRRPVCVFAWIWNGVQEWGGR
mmetsp:Transcript_24471/g.61369  ORF Transcript_24471/g.61369 Transcript_24471/m.61369 type:complete len:89 (-) Transcript_24471:39-305(-)